MKLFLIVSSFFVLAASPAIAQVAVATAEYPGPQPAGGPDGGRKTPSPGTEQALRHQIVSMQAGQPDYGAMTALTAAQARYQNDKMEVLVRQWGALVSLKFVSGAGPQSDVYDATFEHVRVRWTISLGALSKVSGLGYKVFAL